MAPVTGRDALCIGEWLADPADDTLIRGSEKIKIEPRMMRLLMRLARDPGQVVSQDQLLESVWAGVVVGSASIYQSISQLRKTLGDLDETPSYIETVARKGYRLIAPVSRPTKPPVAVNDAPLVAPATVTPLRARPARPRTSWALGVVAAAGVAALAWIAWPGRDTPPPGGGRAAIVVLPIVDLTETRDEQPMCDGLTEELSTVLAQIPSLRVVARTSAYAYRNESLDVREIARRLGATHVVEGSLRRAEGMTRVSVQLIDAAQGLQLWSRSFDLDDDNVLRLQSQVAQEVTGSLRIQLTPRANELLSHRLGQNPEAYRLYLTGRHYARKATRQDNRRALELYRKSLELDQDFIPARLELVHALLNQRYYDSRPLHEVSGEVQSHLDRAAALAPDMPELFVARAALSTDLRDRAAAVRDLERALQLNPRSSEATEQLGYIHLTSGEPRQALAHYSVAAEFDPLNSTIHAFRCSALTDLALFAEAEEACERARTLDPDSAWNQQVSSTMAAARGDLLGALRFNEAATRQADDVAPYRANEARWLLELGLATQARSVYAATVSANPDALQSYSLMTVALEATLASEGPKGLRRFIDESGLGGSADPGILFELANISLQAGDAAAAKVYCARALASPRFEPGDLSSGWLARTGKSYALILAGTARAGGDEPEALKRLAELETLLARMEDGGMRRHGIFLLRAQLAAMRGQSDVAIAHLKRAAEFGWRDVRAAESEPYLAALRERQEYRELLDRIRARNDSDAIRWLEGQKARSDGARGA
jgi:adenylate cyclase